MKKAPSNQGAFLFVLKIDGGHGRKDLMKASMSSLV
jgi:hypothetical protein